MSARHPFYRLEGRFAVPCDVWGFAEASKDPTAWAVALTRVGRARISTVFLGHDANPRPHGPVQVFETMIFGGLHHLSSWRYETWAEAEAGHDRVVAQVRLVRARAMDIVLAHRREARHVS